MNHPQRVERGHFSLHALPPHHERPMGAEHRVVGGPFDPYRVVGRGQPAAHARDQIDREHEAVGLAAECAQRGRVREAAGGQFISGLRDIDPHPHHRHAVAALDQHASEFAITRSVANYNVVGPLDADIRIWGVQAARLQCAEARAGGQAHIGQRGAQGEGHGERLGLPVVPASPALAAAVGLD